MVGPATQITNDQETIYTSSTNLQFKNKLQKNNNQLFKVKNYKKRKLKFKKIKNKSSTTAISGAKKKMSLQWPQA